MTQSEYRTYMQMWTKDRNAFDRWMKASAVAGSLFAAVVLVMAIGSSKVSGPQQVAARATAATEISAAARHGERTDTISPYELTARMAPDQLPVQEVHYRTEAPAEGLKRAFGNEDVDCPIFSTGSWESPAPLAA